MATIEIYGPSSHSQSTTAPAFITASVLIRNLGNATGYARMRITGASSDTGSFTSIPGGQSAVVVANAEVHEWQAGRTITVSAEVDEMSAGYERIGSLGSHRNFRITVAKKYVPPPTYWGGFDPYEPDDVPLPPPQPPPPLPPPDVGRGGYDPYEPDDEPAYVPPPQPPPPYVPPPTYWGGYDPYEPDDEPVYVPPVYPDWIREQEEWDDGMY